MNEMKSGKSYMCMYPKNPDGKPIVKLDKVHSPLKMLSQKEILRSFQKKEKVRPIHVRIGLTSSCNMSCNFCNFHSKNESEFYDGFDFKDKLETEDTINFLKEFRNNGGKAVTFCGSGECTIHPGYSQICYEANKLGLKIGLITNGSMLNNPEISQCVADTHTWVRIGMNSGTAESFHKITNFKESGFMQIFDSVSFLRDHAVEKDFRIGLNFVVTGENYEEMHLAAQLAKNAKAHYIRFEPEFYTGLGHDTINDYLGKIDEYLKKLPQIASMDFEISIPKMDRGRMMDTEAVEGDFTECNYSKLVTALGADGYIYPCPQVHLGVRYRMGEVIKHGYENWLNSNQYEEWKEKNPDRESYCKTCFYRPQNELLNWISNGTLDLETVLYDYEKDYPETIHELFI